MDGRHTAGLGELLRHLTDLVDRGSEAAYRAQGLDYRPPYTPVMRALAEEAAGVGELTDRLAISQGAVSQTAKLMVADGLVSRRPGRDGRRSILALTAKGRRLLGRLQVHWQAVFAAAGDLEDEIGAPLRTYLARAIYALERTGFAQRIARARPGDGQPATPRTAEAPPSAHFRTGGNAYARYRPDYPPELAGLLAEPCAATGTALDVGCGTGQLTTVLAERFERVVGADTSADQLAHAEAHPNVDYRAGSAEALPVDDGSADLVVAAQAAHWFDLDRFYPEVRRVARPGAVVALVSYGVPYIEGPANAVFQRFYWQELPPFWPPERRHVETGYADLPFPFEPLEPPELSIRKAWPLADFLGYLGTWSASRRAVATGRADLFDTLAAELRRHWGDPQTPRPVVWPVSIRLGRV